jgi:hypothetical protein
MRVHQMPGVVELTNAIDLLSAISNNYVHIRVMSLIIARHGERGGSSHG